jgi:hypothetical protein
MKNIEDYVCTLAQAEKLKELGVEQESLFYFADFGFKEPEGIHHFIKTAEDKYYAFFHYNPEGFSEDIIYSAFTSQELGKLIINSLPSYENIAQTIQKDNYIFMNYDMENGWTQMYSNYNSNEAQARAEFLIYILENKQ